MPRSDLLPRLVGEVVLRRLAVSDLSAFQAYRNDPLLGRYQGWSATSHAEAEAFLAEMNSLSPFQPGVWWQIGIASLDSSILLGDIGVLVASDGKHAEIGFTLGRPSQGRGIATLAVREAIGLLFESTHVERVLGITDERNQPSVRLLERVGMRQTESRSVVFKGEPCVELVYCASRQK